MERMTCVICGKEVGFRWSDTHGVAVCYCGMPYRLHHYEGDGTNNKRVEKPPEVAIKDEWIPVAKAYFAETQGRVFPASFDIGFMERNGLSYSGASREDVEKWNIWMEDHPELIPAPVNVPDASAEADQSA